MIYINEGGELWSLSASSTGARKLRPGLLRRPGRLLALELRFACLDRWADAGDLWLITFRELAQTAIAFLRQP
jgi:hypothetical protein